MGSNIYIRPIVHNTLRLIRVTGVHYNSIGIRWLTHLSNRCKIHARSLIRKESIIRSLSYSGSQLKDFDHNTTTLDKDKKRKPKNSNNNIHGQKIGSIKDAKVKSNEVKIQNNDKTDRHITSKVLMAATAINIASTENENIVPKGTDMKSVPPPNNPNPEPVKQITNSNNNIDILRIEAPHHVPFLQKLIGNIKWLLIRNKKRPFSKDEIRTLFSWLIISQIVWLILKTTTVVSLLLLTFNTVFAKEMVALFIGRLLNYFSDEISINFQDALIPEWKSGFIKFKDVKIDTHKGQKNNILEFHLFFHEIEINLSLKKWLQGTGLINDIKVFGIRGETIINYKEKIHNENSQELLLNWFSNPNYKLMNVNISDSKFHVIENFADGSEPTNVKIRIFNLDISGLRFNQLLTDFLKANVITGSINNSLFTFHKRQHKLSYLGDMKDDLSSWDRITRLRLNSINVNALGLNKTNSFNWIEDGDVNLVADIMLPQENEESDDIETEKYLLLDLRFKFKDLRGSLPKVAPALSTGEQILTLDELKPVISFVNLQRILSRSNNYSGNDIRNIIDDDNDEHPFSDTTTNVSIKRKKSYPNVTVIQSDKNKEVIEDGESSEADDKHNNATSIIRFHPAHHSNSQYNSPYDSTSLNSENGNELILHCRLVKNIKDLERVILFQETGIYDQICMELYVDLIKTVEEWEFKNKDEWMKEWGTTFASQLLLFGFTNVM